MPVYKPRSNGIPDAMKSDEGNDSLDTFIRQTMGKEPHLSFSRNGDSPVQLFQILHALDQQENSGWSLPAPVKVQMQKCEKCSREFCSSINYRRHMRVHRRSLNPDKDATVGRDLLGAFWDKLAYDDAMETLSFNNVMLEEVPGSSIVNALEAFIRRHSFSSLPHVKAGSALLDIVQSSAPRFPISSQELFSILDDASEKTFLCGTAFSMQKYIFDGEAGKIGLEMKNLVASTSFLLEQKLVKAWVADKDAEALRCQKLLVEEEEAAQERRAEVMERKRQKKLRQKEQKAKEHANAEKADPKEEPEDSPSESVIETSSSPIASNSGSPSPASTDGVPSFLEPIQQRWEEDKEAAPAEHQTELSSSPFTDFGASVNGEHHTVRSQLATARWPALKFQQSSPYGLHGTNHNPQLSKPGTILRHGANGSKVWSRKAKPKHDLKEAANPHDPKKGFEVLIGSIPVELRNPSGQSPSLRLDDEHDGGAMNDGQVKNMALEKTSLPDLGRSMVKHWRPVSRQEIGDEELKGDDVVSVKANARSSSGESCLTSCAMDESCNGSDEGSSSPSEEDLNSGGFWFSVRDAEAFLTRRWEEAVAAEHAEVVVSSEPDPPECGTTKGELKLKPDKGVKLKQRNGD